MNTIEEIDKLNLNGLVLRVAIATFESSSVRNQHTIPLEAKFILQQEIRSRLEYLKLLLRDFHWILLASNIG